MKQTEDITQCTKCPRLREWCAEVAQSKVKRFKDWEYWGKPVPSFGDVNAKIVIVGLAPAAHGANRTGRMFTGDESGNFLYSALHRAGFANQAHSSHKDDGLQLSGCYITAVAHCAPPENKPTPEELKNCSTWFIEDMQRLQHKQVIIPLGAIAHGVVIRWLGLKAKHYPFGHGVTYRLHTGLTLLPCYHVSQQNTFTGKLTPHMLDMVLKNAHNFTQ